ncbi:hypothetical protein F442_15696 [Phytophthora nicotianae P10297]|uniref:Uncharacterized protein n=5 Tax=Phytophthora nicotianae TaxID=4792 RepID=W2R2F0_PHYN3|nr:hypothetical protein PPTG_04870 [Phytophthora nicotianae INRA-310]ETI38353.1 hypothetical protein F443_15857 [Phytophthora nicotianae P1569]ETK78595.1 hypothetical protein L915_15414 [Phytophthora nicotianae]ETO67164.1 hypothetical protein F444_15838 [Phytophthora nicotianae P1976]ETP36343.1 hypothetical protein F442_15696 [Phytophthora nicotianae P10297]ETL85274.1 hypothetical protein L917_15130 [Phytophthora nicotianae]
MNEIQRTRSELLRELQKVHAMLKRLVMQPTTRLILPSSGVLRPATDPASSQSRARPAVARFSKRPKDLYELWHEYQFGISGLKAAKEFTPAERGANKFAYSRRKPIWDVIT